MPNSATKNQRQHATKRFGKSVSIPSTPEAMALFMYAGRFSVHTKKENPCFFDFLRTASE